MPGAKSNDEMPRVTWGFVAFFLGLVASGVALVWVVNYIEASGG